MSKKTAIVLGITIVGLLIIGVALFCGLYFSLKSNNCVGNQETRKATFQFYGEYDSAAVARDAGPCSVVGKDLLEKGGSVVDAAIGAMLCIGLIHYQSTGIGGESFMNIYDASSGESMFINAREVAPLAADKDMYNDDPKQKYEGASSIAVPGEIAGYWEAHKRFGKLPWAELFQPAISLASDGFTVNSVLAKAIQQKAKFFEKDDYNLVPLLMNSTTNSLKKEGDLMVLPQLATTLRQIAAEGAQTFYNGTLAKRMIQDIKDASGGPSRITEEDLKNYKVDIKPLINITLGDITLLTTGPASGGPILCYILNILKGYNFSADSIKDTDSKILTYHRILEAFKFAYAKRPELGDENFNENITKLVQDMLDDDIAETTRLQINDSSTLPLEAYGLKYQPAAAITSTSHLSVVGQDGSAITMTSSINA